VANHLLWSVEFANRRHVVQAAFQAKVAPVVVEVHPCLCASIVFVNYLMGHFAKKGSCPFDFHKALPGFFLSQPLPDYVRETQDPTSTLLGIRRKDS
jgi:hypothetical protein